MDMADSHRGSRVGPRISVLVSQAIVATHGKLVHAKHKLAMMVFRAISDEISSEVDDTLGPLLRDIADRYDSDGPMRQLVDFLATGHGQWKAIVGTGLSASGLLWSLSTIMNNELAKVVYDALASNPHMIPDVGTISGLAASGRLNPADAQHAYAESGYNSTWANLMTDLQSSYPALAEGLDLIRRQLAGHSEVIAWLVKNGVPLTIAERLVELYDVPVSPADAALAVLRGNLDQASAEKAAGAYGVSKASFEVLLGNTGEPLALMQLLEAKRRGFIDEATLVRGILQSRVRNEWIPTAVKLAYSPISVADAVNAAVQGHITQAKASEVVTQNGVEAGWYDILYQTAGEPLSRTELEQLYNRGLVTEATVKQGIRESRLKDKYVNDAFDLHVRLLEPRMLSRAVTSGSLTHAEAIAKAMEYGFSHADATVLVDEGSKTKLETQRNRVVTAIETLYEDNAVSSEQAAALITGLGYDQSEVTFMLQAAEFRREARSLSTVVNAVRSKYLSHKLDEHEATGYLDSVGVPSAQRDYLLRLWTIERSAYVRTLTEAQVAKAVKLQLIDPSDGLTRLTNMGYSQDDAALLLEGA